MSDKNGYHNFLSQPTLSLSGEIGGWGRNAPSNGWGPLVENVQMGNIAGGLEQLSGVDPALQEQALRARIGMDEAATANFNRQNQPLTGWAKGAQTFGNISQGLTGLGSIYLGYQAMKQQKKAFEFNKGVVNTNLNNSIMDYNRRLGDTLANRALNNGQGQGWVSDQLAKYSAKRS